MTMTDEHCTDCGEVHETVEVEEGADTKINGYTEADCSRLLRKVKIKYSVFSFGLLASMAGFVFFCYQIHPVLGGLVGTGVLARFFMLNTSAMLDAKLTLLSYMTFFKRKKAGETLPAPQQRFGQYM